MPLGDQPTSFRPPKRIRVACTTCRKKKTKCDGAIPCLNCTMLGENNCTYDDRINKPIHVKTKTSRQDAVLMHLNSRLDRLEAMIQRVAGSGTSESEPLPSNPQSLRSSSRTSISDENENIDILPTDDTQSPSPMSAPSPGPESGESNVKQKEIYVGNQSFFSILSKSSISWMKSHLTDDELNLITPLSNLPHVFQNKINCFSKRWFNLTKYQDPAFLETMRSPLPKNKQPMYELIESFSNSFCSMPSLCSGDEIRYSLKRYYSSSDPRKRKLSITQLFKLYTALLVCLSNALEAYFGECLNDGTASPLRSLSLAKTRALRDKLIDVCMGFYSQLNIMGTGLEVVRSTLFFVTFLAKCVNPHEITVSILATAVLKAQEMGLHRIETYRVCTSETFSMKLHVWRLTTYLDMEMCFRTGRPPIINYNDVSPEIEGLLPILTGDNHLRQLSLMTNYEKLFHIRLETYNRLFSATADTKTFAAVQSNVDHLNARMFVFLSQISVEDRPFFYNDPGFSEISQISNTAEEKRLATILTFFCNMMTINRIPSMFALPGASSELLQMYKSLSLNSARTILHLLKNFRPYGPGMATSLWTTFFPLISVLHLSAACMSNPNSPESLDDISLISKICEKWFNRGVVPDRMSSFRFDMTILLEVLVKSVSAIAIKICERNSGIQMLSQNPDIKASLEAPRTIFPELFGSEQNLKDAIPSLFELESPFSDSAMPSPPANGKDDGRTDHEEPLSTASSLSDTYLEDPSADFGIFGGVFDSGPNFGGYESFTFDQLDQYPNIFFDGMENAG